MISKVPGKKRSGNLDRKTINPEDGQIVFIAKKKKKKKKMYARK